MDILKTSQVVEFSKPQEGLDSMDSNPRVRWHTVDASEIR